MVPGAFAMAAGNVMMPPGAVSVGALTMGAGATGMIPGGFGGPGGFGAPGMPGQYGAPGMYPGQFGPPGMYPGQYGGAPGMGTGFGVQGALLEGLQAKMPELEAALLAAKKEGMHVDGLLRD